MMMELKLEKMVRMRMLTKMKMMIMMMMKMMMKMKMKKKYSAVVSMWFVMVGNLMKMKDIDMNVRVEIRLEKILRMIGEMEK